MTRPVLIGMNNSLSNVPEYALYPVPAKTTGGRVYALLNDERLGLPPVSWSDYLAGFVRVNVVTGEWSDARARAAGPSVRRLADELRTEVIVLGEKTWWALGLPAHPLVDPLRRTWSTWRRLPHPSGRVRWYNDETNKLVAAMLLREAYERGQPCT